MDIDETDLPAVALKQEILYRLEIMLIVVYGGLLLLTPLYYGLMRGRLPIEVSARGARYAEAADEALAFARDAIGRLQRDVNRVKAEQIKDRLIQARKSRG